MAVFSTFVYVVICTKSGFFGKRVAKDTTPSCVSCNEKGFLSQQATEMRKMLYFLQTRVKDVYLWKESDLRCPARSRREVFVVVSDKYVEMVPLLSPAIYRKEKLR